MFYICVYNLKIVCNSYIVHGIMGLNNFVFFTSIKKKNYIIMSLIFIESIYLCILHIRHLLRKLAQVVPIWGQPKDSRFYFKISSRLQSFYQVVSHYNVCQFY